MNREATGILSYSKDLFIVAELEISPRTSCAFDIYLLYSWTENWKLFRDIPISIDGITNLGWWSTDAVIASGYRYLIWIDYLRGIIVADMDCENNGIDLQRPILWYVPLPIDPVKGNPYHSDYGRGYPERSRGVCDTRRGIKFVNINQCDNRFTITLWSLCDDRTWKEEATLDAARDIDCGMGLPNGLGMNLPNVQPEFPLVDIENPDVICFLLNKGHHNIDPEAETLMVKVNMRKKILLDCISYSNKRSSSCQNSYMTARVMSEELSFISTEMPSYL